MPVLAEIVMTTAQRNAAEALNDVVAALGSRQIDNPLANNLGHGTLVGMWIAPARLLNDPMYSRWYATLGTLPIYILDSDILFIPDPEI